MRFASLCVAGVVLSLGCSSASGGSGDPVPVHGSYVGDDKGPVQELNFVDDSHYVLWRSPCADGEKPAPGANRCRETGSFELNDARTELTLTDADTGRSTTMPFRGIATQGSLTKPSTSADTLRPQDGLTGGGGSLVQGSTSLVSFQAGGQLYNQGTCLVTGDSGSISAHASAAYDYFVGKGLTNYQAAGIIGNLMVESYPDLRTDAQESGPPYLGRGIAQWNLGARWDTTPNDNVKDFANQRGVSQYDFDMQLDFIWWELQNRPEDGLGDLQAAQNLSEAEYAFQSKFERCGACNQDDRLKDAQQVLDAKGGSGGCNCGVHNDDHRLYCSNRVTPVYEHPWSSSTVVDTLRSTSSWFSCWFAGEAHSGGNTTWYWTQGDDHGAWGFVPASALDTPGNFDTTASQQGLPQCGQ